MAQFNQNGHQRTGWKFYVTSQYGRVSIRSSTRWRIGIRDGFRCRYCRQRVWPWAQPTIDHVIPWSRGGRNWGNLVWSCWPCNQRKGARIWRPRPLTRWQRLLDGLMIFAFDWPRWEDFRRGGRK